MDHREALVLGRSLLASHGLEGWRLVFDDAKTRAGRCRADRREISLSRVLTSLHDEDVVRDTLLHEIAHALVGPAHGHDAEWRRVARAIGCSGTRCVPEQAPRAPAPWRGVCPAGHIVSRHQRPVRVTSCRTCSPRFDLRHRHVWTWHGLEVAMHPEYVSELDRLTRAGPGQPAPAPRLRPGAVVRLGGRGRYGGLVGTVVGKGRTRYRVVTSVGVVSAPFGLVEPVPARPP